MFFLKYSHHALVLLFFSATPLLFQACAERKGEAEFQPYIDSFYKAAEERGMHLRNEDLVIRFGETLPGATAQCVLSNARPSMGGTEIIVNREGWMNYEDPYFHPEREILIFHELGHCLLGRGHQEKTINLCDRTDEKNVKWHQNIPLSLMKKSNYIDPTLYLKLRGYYLDQLFFGKPSKVTAKITRAPTPALCRQESDESESAP